MVECLCKREGCNACKITETAFDFNDYVFDEFDYFPNKNPYLDKYFILVSLMYLIDTDNIECNNRQKMIESFEKLLFGKKREVKSYFNLPDNYLDGFYAKYEADEQLELILSIMTNEASDNNCKNFLESLTTFVRCLEKVNSMAFGSMKFSMKNLLWLYQENQNT